MDLNPHVNPYWRKVASGTIDDIKEALITGYKSGARYLPHNFPLLNPAATPCRILDFGCGIGRNFSSLQRFANSLTGFDIPEMIEACRLHSEIENAELSSDWNAIASKRYDLTVATLTLQHVTPRSALLYYLEGIARISPYLYISSRAWWDGEQHDNLLKLILDTGHFEFFKGSLNLDEALSFEYPGGEHFEIVFKSLKCDTRNDELETLFDLESRGYTNWIRRYGTVSDTQRSEYLEKIAHWDQTPLISVLTPTYNTPTEHLTSAIDSVLAQIYPHFELCIADDASTDGSVIELLRQYQQRDPRIKVVTRADNGHIAAASNSALELSSGSFLALFDHDDLLSPDALYHVVSAINEHPDVQLLYSDEDKLDASGERIDPYFKCDWNYELFLSHNLLSHLGVYKTSLVKSIGGFRPGYDGSQDYDLALRCIEKINPEQIVHIPRVLYHWRMAPGSTSKDHTGKPYAYGAAQRAIESHLKRCAIEADVLEAPDAEGQTRVRYHLQAPYSQVTIVIPTRDQVAYLERCINSIKQRTCYTNYKILIVDNDSSENEALKYLADLNAEENIDVIPYPKAFNYAAIMNFAIERVNTELLVMLNNDTEILNDDWLDELISQLQKPGVGVVGARLWYPDLTLQHAGVIMGMTNIAGHHSRGTPKGNVGYFGRAVLLQNLSAVTGACIATRKSLYFEVGGMNDNDLAISFNDIDYCLKVRELGYRVVWTPYAELIHHESASRGKPKDQAAVDQLRREADYMRKTWPKYIAHDPAFSPNLSIDSEHIGYAFPPRV